MRAFSVLTPVLLSRCCADSPNKQCVGDCTVSKSIIWNVFTLGYHRGYFIDWIPSWFFWWRVLTAGSASSSQSCLYWARALLNSLSDILYCIRVSTKRNSSLGNDNLPLVGQQFLLKTVWWPPNWSTTISILAWHEVETPPTPQIHSHGIWCDVGKWIINDTTIYHRGKWIPTFLWKDAENLDSRRPTMSLLFIVQETSVKYSKPSCNVYG
jgi:hypothetical protein